MNYIKLKEGKGEYEGQTLTILGEYRAENVFYVPPQARWDTFKVEPSCRRSAKI